MTMKTLPEISPIPLTAELFDAMFDNDHFRAHLKAHWEEVAAEKEAKAAADHLASIRRDGTESILREEFWNRPNATEEEIAARRAELHAEFDQRFG